MPTTTQITTTMISARPVPTGAAQNEGASPRRIQQISRREASSHIAVENNPADEFPVHGFGSHLHVAGIFSGSGKSASLQSVRNGKRCYAHQPG
jgi:hypothetical protein